MYVKKSWQEKKNDSYFVKATDVLRKLILTVNNKTISFLTECPRATYYISLIFRNIAIHSICCFPFLTSETKPGKLLLRGEMQCEVQRLKLAFDFLFLVLHANIFLGDMKTSDSSLY